MIDIEELIREALFRLEALRNIRSYFKNYNYRNKKDLSENIDKETQIKLIKQYIEYLEDTLKTFPEFKTQDLIFDYTIRLETAKELIHEPVNESEIHSLISKDKKFFKKYQVIKYCKNSDKTYTIINIPKKEEETVIKYLKSQFPLADDELIVNIVKSYEI
jgi:uncharacterized protein YqeY